MDLVKIGFLIKADGLKDANTQVDQLLNKVDNIGAKGKKAATDFESSQKKASESVTRTKKSTDSLLASQQKQIEMSRKAIALEQTRSKYATQGYGKTDAARLARMELSGADVTTLNNYKQAINETNKAIAALKPTIDSTSQSHSKFTDQVKGIAIYAALSAAIYGVMTAMTNLAVATVKMADEYTAIQNRMKLYIKDAEELGKVNVKLAQYAMENNVGLRETATLFTRLAPSMQKLGANTAAITSVVDAFGKSMRIGGATAMEATSATIQFSQAMAAGKLQGDEFRSISEASPRFLRAIAEGANIAASQLKEMSSAGMLTTEVISKALLREYPKLIEENARLGVTLEQGANAIKTSFTMMIGELNEGAGVTQAIGQSMMSVAKSMASFAQTARETGTNIQVWFTKNADTINLLVNAFKVLTAIVVSRYVAAIILARVESIRYQATLLSMAAAQTQATRTSTLLAAALTGVGNAAKGALAFFGGWVGLGLTVATAAASYFLLRDNTDAATKALQANEGAVRKTKEELQQLVGAQKELEKSKLKELYATQAAGLEELNEKILAIIVAERARANFSDEMTTLLRGVRDGTISYSDALKQLNTQKGVDPKNIGTMQELIGQYNKLAAETTGTVDDQRAIGESVRMVGNAAQNSSPQVKQLKNDYDGLGDAAAGAASKVSKLAVDARKAIGLSKIKIEIAKAYGLSEESSGILSEAAYDNVATIKSDGKVRDLTEKRNKLQAELNEEKKKGLDISVKQLEIAKLNKEIDTQTRLATRDYIHTNAQFLKQQDAQKEKERKHFETIRQQAKEAGEVNPFPDQAESLQRMIDLLNQGVETDVARIASQKEYLKWFGLNITQAEELANLEKQRNFLESQAQARESYSQNLASQADELEVINDFLAEGVMLEQAKAVAAAKYQANSVGYSMIVRNMVNDLSNQSDLLYEQFKYQEGINSLKEMGFSEERAAFEYRVKKLREAALLSGKALSDKQEKLIENVRNNVVATEQNKKRLAYDEKIRDVQQQIANTLNFETLAMADIANSNKDLSKEAVRELAVRNEILESFRKQKELEQQKSENPFMDIDFSVFGDFGNPFQSALEGLNSLLFGMDNLAAKYEERKKYLSADVENAKKGTKEETEAKEALAQLEKNYITDVARMKEKRIEDGLKLTKLMFKEDSKGYKLMSALEMAYQAKSIAMEIKNFAIKKGLLAADTMAFQAATAKKMLLDGVATAATVANNMVKATSSGIAALASSMAGLPFPLNLAAFAATGALLASIGLNLAGGGSAKGTFAPTNEGTGTVFGDTDAKSESIKKSIDLLADNSDLMLPLTDAMLRSLRNIESNIGGLTNLLIRTGVGKDFNIAEGFEMNAIGSGISNTFSLFNDLTFGLADFLTLGLFSAVGDLLGGLFGTKTTVKGQGLFGRNQSLASILENGFSLQEYVDVNTKKKTLGITTSNKNKTILSAADQQLANQFTLIFEGFYDSILNASTALGMNVNTVADALEGTVISMGKINLQGLKGEEIQEKLMAVFGAAADKLAQTGVKGLDDFQKVGEGYYETLVRVATGIEQANYFTDRLNVTAIKYADILNKQGDVAAEIVRQSVLLVDTTKSIKGGFYDLVNTFEGSAEELTNFIFTLRDLQDQLFMTGKDADYLTSAMILGAGGLDKLSSGFDAYFEMLSPAEQAAELTRRLTNEFAIFGKELPADVKAFRNLVSSIDITTEAGQKLYGQIIALAPEFNDLQDALESANSDVNALVQSLRDLAEQARQARGETEQPRNLDYARAMFESTAMLAMQGDTEAAGKLMSLGTNLMNLSKQYSVDGSEYARDLAWIQRAATVAADVQEAGLGYTSSTLSTALSSGNTTPTLATTSTSTDTKLDALREDLNAALLAIAKYTQSTASKLENWDGGDRMTVRVEQFGSNDKIPVSTA